MKAPDRSSRPDREDPSDRPARAYSWFPGHMKKALRQLDRDLSLADAVLLVCDARIPAASLQPDLEAMAARRGLQVLYIFNKSDLADRGISQEWLRAFRQRGRHATLLSALGGGGAGPLTRPLEGLRERVHAARRARGLLPRDPRLIVAGIPNVGKSSLLNRLVGGARARTGARPGVTRGAQWVVTPGRWQIMDSPGILYPRIEGQETLVSLAAAGCVSLDALPLEQVAEALLARLAGLGRGPIPDEVEVEPGGRLERLARRRNLHDHGRSPDLARAARWLLQATARGDLGPLSLERPEPWTEPPAG